MDQRRVLAPSLKQLNLIGGWCTSLWIEFIFVCWHCFQLMAWTCAAQVHRVKCFSEIFQKAQKYQEAHKLVVCALMTPKGQVRTAHQGNVIDFNLHVWLNYICAKYYKTTIQRLRDSLVGSLCRFHWLVCREKAVLFMVNVTSQAADIDLYSCRWWWLDSLNSSFYIHFMVSGLEISSQSIS